MIRGKCKLRVLWDLRDDPRRYGELKRALAEFGLIARKDFGTVPPRVEYRLTAEGRTPLPVISVLHKWGVRHLVLDAVLRAKGLAPRH
jgi:DNA-binding HxlR family transcriptional regulator